jgi:N-acetyl-gamma-glutamyl-phosphate reductase
VSARGKAPGESPARLRAAVVGATGYTGAELVRLLLQHPRVELAAVISRSQVGERLDSVHPALAGFTELRFVEADPVQLARFDAVFLAVPHGGAGPWVEALDHARAPLVLDLSADHRVHKDWVYGLAEWRRDAIAAARRIAVPGCFATAIALGIAPFVARGRVRGPVRVVAATGSTGSGAAPSRPTHHPERFVNMKAYKVLEHQHVAEITNFLRSIGHLDALHFVPVSAPLDRGILASSFIEAEDEKEAGEAAAVVRAAYEGKPLVRLRAEPPELRHVRGSALCDVSVHHSGREVVVLTAVDNLGKGAAAQALQCMNLALGLPETAGLGGIPCLP